MGLEDDLPTQVFAFGTPEGRTVDPEVAAEIRACHPAKKQRLALPMRHSVVNAPVAYSVAGARSHHMHTREITTTIVRNAVFGTAELLEAILLQLPGDDLIALRRINKRWNLTILHSPKILRKLFLRRVQHDAKSFWIFDTLTSQVRPYHPKDAGESDEWTDRQRMSRPVMLNRMLFKTLPEHKREAFIDRVAVCESLHLVSRPDLRIPVWTSLYHHMFVTQPPVCQVTFIFYLKPRGWGREVSVQIECERSHGVRLGDLLEELQKDPNVQAGPQDLVVRVKPRGAYGKTRSVVWAIGAVFASDEEKALVDARSRAMTPDPML